MSTTYKPCPAGCGGRCAKKARICLSCKLGRGKPTPLPTCQRCGTPIVGRGVTGYCQPCRLTTVREQTRAARLAALPEVRADRRAERDTYAASPLPAEPCPHPPGSEGRMRTLEQRAARGESMTHPEDFQHE